MTGSAKEYIPYQIAASEYFLEDWMGIIIQ